jgi:deoxyribonuclease-4
MQIFTHNPRGWATKPIVKQAIDAFRELRKKFDINPVYAHASYLINIASPDNALRDMSGRLLREELARADCLDIDYVVLHTGVAYDPKIPRGKGAISVRVLKIWHGSSNIQAAVFQEYAWIRAMPLRQAMT